MSDHKGSPDFIVSRSSCLQSVFRAYNQNRERLHPFLSYNYDYFHEVGHGYLVMGFIEGKTLEDNFATAENNVQHPGI